MNTPLVTTSLAVLLLASAQAERLLSADSGWCRGNRFEESTGAQNVYTGQRVSLDFKDADIVNVLRLLSEIGGENVVITDDVKGRITLRLVDVPWDQALDIVLATNGLGPAVRCDP